MMWTAFRDFSRPRAPLTSANPLMTRRVTRLQNDWSPTLVMVVARRPTMPASSVASETGLLTTSA